MKKPIKKKKVITPTDRITVIEFPALIYKFTVIHTDDFPGSYFRHYKFKYSETSKSAGMVSASEERESVIFIRKGIRDLEEVIAHECYHAMKGMEKAIGNNDGGEEFFAYHLGYLVRMVHEFIKE